MPATVALGRRALVRAYHVGDDLDEPAELVFYCPSCAASEIDSD
jgi:hypothetical protein